MHMVGLDTADFQETERIIHRPGADLNAPLVKEQGEQGTRVTGMDALQRMAEQYVQQLMTTDARDLAARYQGELRTLNTQTIVHPVDYKQFIERMQGALEVQDGYAG